LNIAQAPAVESSVGPHAGVAVMAEANEARGWTRILLRYREPSLLRSILELGITFGPLAALWVTMWLCYSVGLWWVTLLLAVPSAGFLVRLFMIQHDCGHGAFFRHRIANDWIGRALGVVTFTPYDFWRRMHSMHHATSGNLERRGMGDIDTLTVNEYLALSRWGRLKYRLYRHPLVMFGVGPAYMFILQHRLPIGLMRGGWSPWLSTFGTNAAIAIFAGLLIWQIGVVAFVLVHLFYVQHQFEHTQWARNETWDLHEVALHGSSYYVLPGFLRWFTANIGIHHVHHLCSKIPYYRLPRVLNEHPELGHIGRLTLWESIKCVRLVLWDESAKKLISFREMRNGFAAA
jgi:omega-6 fatty acid desaturase (delta-12 desaturase)